MPTSDEWSREVDEALFRKHASDKLRGPSRSDSMEFPPLPEARAGRAVALEDFDAALFGSAEPGTPTARTARDAPPEVLLPSTVDELFADEADVITQEVVLGDEPSPPSGRRGRRRALVVAAMLALVVIGGVAFAASGVGRSGGPRPTGNTVPESKPTTTIPTTTTLPAPETSAPVDSAPSPAPARPRPTTTTSRSPATTAPAAPAPPPPAPPTPPPPEPPPEPPPSTSPPTTISVP